MFSDPCCEISKATEDVSVSGDQLSLAGVEIGQRSESVDLQFKDKLVGIERLDAAGEPDGTHRACTHALSLNRTMRACSAAAFNAMQETISLTPGPSSA